MTNKENTRLIPLTQGRVALVDIEDFEELNKYKWQSHRNHASRHKAVTKKPDGKWCYITILMHRFIMKAKKGQEIDHVNGNGLDNRKVNLRFCTRSQNCSNSVKKNKSKKYKGIYFRDRSGGSWEVMVIFKRQRHFIGIFKNEKEAALAYNEAAKKYHGEFAKLNEI